ncbi:hypothetical protein GQ53DRAFT_826157 [Thozetella sp. PMI_491]|nr:hypothetical protein GQ53DRAFT_826157 [Thozetella sp. PMI_491]
MKSSAAACLIAGVLGGVLAWKAKGTWETVSYENQQLALKCLDMNFCDAHRLRRGANARCRVNDAVVAVCNYSQEKFGVQDLGLNYCSIREMWSAMDRIEQVAPGSKTGWWLEPDWAKAYFFTPTRGSRELEDQCDNNDDFWQFDMECGDHISDPTGCINHSYNLPYDWWSFQYPPDPIENLDDKGKFRPKKSPGRRSSVYKEGSEHGARNFTQNM